MHRTCALQCNRRRKDIDHDADVRRRRQVRQGIHGHRPQEPASLSKGWQSIAVEATEYSKKSFETGSAAIEKLVSAKSLEKAIEIQTDFAKQAYEGFVAEATKIGELYAELYKDTYKPFESIVAKAK